MMRKHGEVVVGRTGIGLGAFAATLPPEAADSLLLEASMIAQSLLE